MGSWDARSDTTTVKLEPTAAATSISGRARRTTPSTIANPHFAKAARQLDDNGALHTFHTKHHHQRVELEPPTPLKACLEDAAHLTSMPPHRAEFDAFCVDDSRCHASSIDLPSELLFDKQDAEVLMRLSAVSATMRARIPRAQYLQARTELQAKCRLAVYHRMCTHCGAWVLKVNMPGPSMKVCKSCWSSLMDQYSCNEWAVVRMNL